MVKKENRSNLFSYLWQVVILGIIFSVSLIMSRLFIYSLGINLPRLPKQAEESAAIYYLFVGSIILAAGLLPLFKKIKAKFMTRFLLMFFFFYISFGLGTSLESMIYSSFDGFGLMIVVFFLPVLIFSLVVSLLVGSEQDETVFKKQFLHFFSQLKSKDWIWRIFLAIISFPIIYFVFGMLVSPLVLDYYQESGLGLAVPEFGTIVSMQLLRSALFLLVTIPILVKWSGSKKNLILSLGLAHSVMVFCYDIVLAYQLPFKLVIIHGLEILLDSFVYAFVFVKLLYHQKSTK